MLIQMRAAVRMQDAGAERPLSVGQTYEVADLVGRDLLATGRAVLAEMRAPETKGAQTGKRGRR